MKKILQVFGLLIFSILTLIAIFLEGLTVYMSTNKTTDDYVLIRASLVFVPVILIFGWISILLFRHLFHLVNTEKKLEKVEKRRKQKAEKQQKRDEKYRIYLEKERQKKEAKFKQYLETQAKIEEQNKQQQAKKNSILRNQNIEKERQLNEYKHMRQREEILNIIRCEDSGIEILIGFLLYLSSYVYFFAVAIAAAQPLKNTLTQLSITTKLLYLAAITVIAFGGFFTLIFLGVNLKKQTYDARQTIFIKTQSGHLYYCKLFTEFIDAQYTGNKVIRIIHNADIAEQNDERVRKTVAYSKTEEFTNMLTPLLHGEKVDLPYTHIFEDCDHPKICEKGIFFHTLLYYDPETDQTKKIKIHRSLYNKI
ncbi:MAG: hypothetical protein Q4D51_01475 [Eubacteriales bacterium]|nr:hypothetical protein [Eubacteriales bacterium]